MSPFISRSVDTSGAPSFFSSLPVINSEPEALQTIEEALRQTIDSCTVPGAKERRKAEYRHTNPAGNLFGLCFPTGEKERLGYVVKFIEFLCIVDDVMEDLPFGEACIEHAILRQALYDKYDEDQYSGRVVGGMKSFLRDVRLQLVEQDDPSGKNQLLLETLDTSLHQRDSVALEFETFEQYVPYRKTNFDYDFVCQLIRWATNIPLSFDEVQEEMARRYEHSIGVIAPLTNDYFSWNMERHEKTDRMRNAVPVLMKEHCIPEKQAMSLLRDNIIAEENNLKRMRAEIEGSEDVSDELKRYLTVLEHFAAGYSFWCSTCPRYSRPQRETKL